MPLLRNGRLVFSNLLVMVLMCDGLLTACTVHQGTKTYIGLVRVHVPPAQPGIHSVHAAVLGLALDRGLRLGWSRTSTVETDPAVCQITVLVDRNTNLAALKAQLEPLGSANICFADFR